MNPPSLSCRSMRHTSLPARASSAAATKELIPEPMIAISPEFMQRRLLSEVRVAGGRVVFSALEHEGRPAGVFVFLNLAHVDHMVTGVVAGYRPALERGHRPLQQGNPGNSFRGFGSGEFVG